MIKLKILHLYLYHLPQWTIFAPVLGIPLQPKAPLYWLSNRVTMEMHCQVKQQAVDYSRARLPFERNVTPFFHPFWESMKREADSFPLLLSPRLPFLTHSPPCLLWRTANFFSLFFPSFSWLARSLSSCLGSLNNMESVGGLHMKSVLVKKRKGKTITCHRLNPP